MILIDKAVSSVELLDYFPLSSRDIARKSGLSSGDIAFTGNGPDGLISIAIELKSLSDFIDSIRTKRLHGRQTRLMLKTYDLNYLVVYGVYRCDPSTGDLLCLRGRDWTPYRIHPASTPLQYSFVESCLFSAEAIGMRTRVLPYSSSKHHIHDTRQHLALWIFCLYSWWQKQWSEHKSIRVFDQSRDIVRSTSDMRTMGLSDSQLLVASIAKELPGISYERAIAIAKHFKVPAEFADAIMTPGAREIAQIETTSEKGRVAKIGPVIAGKIRKSWSGKS